MCLSRHFFLFLLFQTPRSIFIFNCTNLKVVYSITLIFLVIGKAQFRRAMLSCDSSCYRHASNEQNVNIPLLINFNRSVMFLRLFTNAYLCTMFIFCVGIWNLIWCVILYV